MKINKLEVLETGEYITVRSYVEFAGTGEYLWYSMDAKYEKYLTVEKLDAFLIGALLLGMKHGEDIIVDGTVSEKLFYNLSSYYIKILSIMIPNMHEVKIIPQDLDGKGTHACRGAVGTGFSAGIDSLCTFIQYTRHDTPPHYRITHLVFNNIGSHGSDLEKAKKLFKSRYTVVKDFATEVGVDIIMIDSNLHALLQMSMPMTHVPRNISSVLLLQGLFGKYIYSADHRFEDWFLYQKIDTRFLDPATVHLLSTETLECVSSGCQYSRPEKTAIISDYPTCYKYLNVCIHPREDGRNCSRCEKCLRTLFTLEMLGRVKCFEAIFDLVAYQRERTRYLIWLMSNRNISYNREILEFSKKIGYRFPLWAIALGCVFYPFMWLFKRLKNVGRVIKRSLLSGFFSGKGV
jgi:hypothetical protein